MHQGPRVVPNVVPWKAVLKIVPLKVTLTVFPTAEKLAKSKKMSEEYLHDKITYIICKRKLILLYFRNKISYIICNKRK
jgi:hypothetical protein